MSVRASFVERFGEDQAVALEAAAEEHKNGVHDNKGSDPFKWVLCICIGYECFTEEHYRAYHGVTAAADEIRDWAVECADLGTHNGDSDYIALFSGIYDAYLSEASTGGG